MLHRRRLLAGHSLNIPPQMEFWSEQELRRNRVWENEEVRMRLRDGVDGHREFRIDSERPQVENAVERQTSEGDVEGRANQNMETEHEAGSAASDPTRLLQSAEV